ncbi:hypothetical protein [Streptomyces sp. NPDC029526]|uniref:hypothetical protein n=1 Tax=Streptomyces sp. NPDC029526 TaxID=3155728 RepID=UPI0033D09459
MNDRGTAAMHALPDGEAELTLVVRLPWEDVARLGQEAGRLAAQMQRPVTLDEAVGHRLRSARATAAHAKPAGEQPPPAVPPASAGAAPVASSGSVSSLPSRPPSEQARQAIERINGSA